MFGRRPDATLATEVPMMRLFLPYVSPRRNESVFYMMQEIEVEAALEFLEKRNRERPPDRRITLFHLFLRSCSQALYLRPGVNRFVKGGKLWQRDGEWITFSAKKEIKDGSPMLTIKRRFHPTSESLDEMVDGIYDRLRSGRSGQKTTSDKEMNLLNTKFEANWNLIKERKQKLIKQNNERENKNRIEHQYKEGDKVLYDTMKGTIIAFTHE